MLKLFIHSQHFMRVYLSHPHYCFAFAANCCFFSSLATTSCQSNGVLVVNSYLFTVISYLPILSHFFPSQLMPTPACSVSAILCSYQHWQCLHNAFLMPTLAVLAQYFSYMNTDSPFLMPTPAVSPTILFSCQHQQCLHNLFSCLHQQSFPHGNSSSVSTILSWCLRWQCLNNTFPTPTLAVLTQSFSHANSGSPFFMPTLPVSPQYFSHANTSTCTVSLTISSCQHRQCLHKTFLMPTLACTYLHTAFLMPTPSVLSSCQHQQCLFNSLLIHVAVLTQYLTHANTDI